MRTDRFIAFIVLSIAAGGCAFVPSLDDATGTSDSPLLVTDIVERLKCEIAEAFAEKLDPRGSEYIWLKDWTIKADLTLQANQAGGISPSGTYTTFQKSAANTAAGPASFGGTTPGLVQQFFTFSANANFGEQALRTETLSFSLSLKELSDQRSANRLACAPYGAAGLVGNLGLREWVKASLAPAANGVLLAGTHPAPGTGAKPSSPQIVGKPSPITGTIAFVEPAKPKEPGMAERMAAALAKAVRAELDATNGAQSVRQSWQTLDKQLDDAKRLQAGYAPISPRDTVKQLRQQRLVFDGLWESARGARSCAIRQLCGTQYGSCATFSGPGATDDTPGATAECPRLMTCPSPDHPEAASGARMSLACVLAARARAEDDSNRYGNWLDAAEKAAAQASEYATDVKSLSDYAQKLVGSGPSPPDPPIDSIGHSVQFVLAYGAGITPSWTLLAWKGPGVSAPMLAASATRTHLLQLALGPASGSSKISTELNRIIQNQTIFLSRP